jgi:DinB superfamily
MSVFSNTARDSAEDRAKYAPAVLDLLGNRQPLDVLRLTPDAAQRAIAGLAASQLQMPEAPGKWSIAHVLRHLADSEVVWGWRMRLILAHERPTITGYDQDLWADRLHYGEADVADSLDALRVLRRDNLKLLERATPSDLQRVGVHSERGEESVGYLMRLYAGHDLLHLNQIDRIRNAIA